jgi:hypothetical protein
MSTVIDQSRIFTREQVERLLTATIGKTLLQADAAQLFAHHEGRDKVKGIAGDIIEESVLGCKKDSKQEPDILVDGVLTELKTTGMIEPKKKIILDAKYYKETLVSRYGEGGKIRREHLSQILTYVMNQENDATPHTKATKGILVYPTIDTELDVSYVYKNTNHVIRVSTVNLNQDWQMIEQRLKDIIQEQKQ